MTDYDDSRPSLTSRRDDDNGRLRYYNTLRCAFCARACRRTVA